MKCHLILGYLEAIKAHFSMEYEGLALILFETALKDRLCIYVKAQTADCKISGLSLAALSKGTSRSSIQTCGYFESLFWSKLVLKQFELDTRN